MNNYAKIIVKGSPITKSNFKLFNLQGRAILPYNSGKYHDRYAVYEQEIAYEAKVQNPNIILSESLIAILKVYYKSKKRHPDTINITKSIFDGIEKSGLIINDAQVRKIIVEEFYDKENPRFELELFGESSYCIDYNIKKRESNLKPVEYGYPPNSKSKASLKTNKETLDKNSCSICGKKITNNDCFTANKGTIKICKECFKKSF
ncbi:RusA family crossover junction endodeoxyribonuclease [Clostridium cochlearium]|uniref:RusA family crossover junction endodeoxyribonuclease n=1 Tax=Clostridium cochlearium TaxID=1494 RepID=UPI001459ADC1|nr:RusA family crossover junction endodeoxyribonuclease [Clostridium cochlearium]MCG4571012.1 RusA family crossover junction endodeoxyribonuclease [Clostridium cochlearium]MCG4579151.1 RusA family crossover junction endodeoxyribonuclease [Clostridium cochlearium]NME95776.1 RusA family crossover junction endodeoxyribonuclease [Clostridium cochlearium]